MDFREEVFDVSKLDEYQVGHLQYVLNSPSYGDVFVPYLKGVRNFLNAEMLDVSQARKDRLSNDFLAGGIVVIDGLLSLFQKLIEETDIDRVIKTQEMTGEQQYEALRQAGMVKPASGFTEPEQREYDPAEDF